MERLNAQCWICSGKSSPKSPLLHFCRCRGSVALAHQSCINQWVVTNQHGECQLCQYTYQHVTQLLEAPLSLAPNAPFPTLSDTRTQIELAYRMWQLYRTDSDAEHAMQKRLAEDYPTQRPNQYNTRTTSMVAPPPAPAASASSSSTTATNDVVPPTAVATAAATAEVWSTTDATAMAQFQRLSSHRNAGGSRATSLCLFAWFVVPHILLTSVFSFGMWFWTRVICDRVLAPLQHFASPKQPEGGYFRNAAEFTNSSARLFAYVILEGWVPLHRRILFTVFLLWCRVMMVLVVGMTYRAAEATTVEEGFLWAAQQLTQWHRVFFSQEDLGESPSTSEGVGSWVVFDWILVGLCFDLFLKGMSRVLQRWCVYFAVTIERQVAEAYVAEHAPLFEKNGWRRDSERVQRILAKERSEARTQQQKTLPESASATSSPPAAVVKTTTAVERLPIPFDRAPLPGVWRWLPLHRLVYYQTKPSFDLVVARQLQQRQQQQQATEDVTQQGPPIIYYDIVPCRKQRVWDPEALLDALDAAAAAGAVEDEVAMNLPVLDTSDDEDDDDLDEDDSSEDEAAADDDDENASASHGAQRNTNTGHGKHKRQRSDDDDDDEDENDSDDEEDSTTVEDDNRTRTHLASLHLWISAINRSLGWTEASLAFPSVTAYTSPSSLKTKQYFEQHFLSSSHSKALIQDTRQRVQEAASLIATIRSLSQRWLWLLLLAIIASQPHSGVIALGLIVIGAVAIRISRRHTAWRYKNRRHALLESMSARRDLPLADVMISFLTFVSDILCFTVGVPLLGGYALHFALLPLLGHAPFSWLAWNWGAYLGTAHYGATVFDITCVSEALQWTASCFLEVFLAPARASGPLDLLLHGMVGTSLMVLLIEIEAVLFLVLFAPGVDIFWARSTEFSHRRDVEKLSVSLAVSQVLDCDPLRVMREVCRTAVVEVTVLFLFVSIPQWGTVMLMQLLYPVASPGGEQVGEFFWEWLEPLKQLWSSVVPDVLSLIPFLTSGASDADNNSNTAATVMTTTTTAAPLGSEGSSSSSSSWTLWHVGINLLCFSLFVTIVRCFNEMPLWRLQTRYLAPLARRLGALFGLHEFLFDAERDAVVDEWLAAPWFPDETPQLPLLPRVPVRRLFSRRELQLFVDDAGNRKFPPFHMTRKAFFSALLYLCMTILFWTVPVVVAALMAPFRSDDGNPLVFALLMWNLPIALLNSHQWFSTFVITVMIVTLSPVYAFVMLIAWAVELYSGLSRGGLVRDVFLTWHRVDQTVMQMKFDEDPWMDTLLRETTRARAQPILQPTASAAGARSNESDDGEDWVDDDD